MKGRFFRKVLSFVLAVALLVTGIGFAKVQKTNAATTVGSAADYTGSYRTDYNIK